MFMLKRFHSRSFPREPQMIGLGWAMSLALGIFVLTSIPAQAESEEAKLLSFFQAYLDRHFRQEPLAATVMGDHRFDAQLENLSPESREQWEELTRKTLSNLPRQVDF